MPVTKGRSGKCSWVAEMLLWDVWEGQGGTGSRAAGLGVHLTSVTCVTGKQILREVRLKFGLLFTDQIIKCRPSVFLGVFMWLVLYWARHCAGGAGYDVYGAGEGIKGFFFLLPSFPPCQGVQTVSLTLRVWVRPVQWHRVQHHFSVVRSCAAFETQKVFVLFL